MILEMEQKKIKENKYMERDPIDVIDEIEERNNLLAAQLQIDELKEFQEAQAQFEDWEQYKADELAKEKYMED